MQLLSLIESTLNAMGYELVDVEHDAQGLLRVLLDKPEAEDVQDVVSQVDSGITIDDCEKVSRQLSHMFAVEDVAYERLEVSSPGLDRPLRTLANYTRFAGREIQVKLRVAFAGRKNYTGVLHAPIQKDGVEVIGLEFEGKDGLSLLEFTLADVEKARLVPMIDFKRNRK